MYALKKNECHAFISDDLFLLQLFILEKRSFDSTFVPLPNLVCLFTIRIDQMLTFDIMTITIEVHIPLSR